RSERYGNRIMTGAHFTRGAAPVHDGDAVEFHGCIGARACKIIKVDRVTSGCGGEILSGVLRPALLARVSLRPEYAGDVDRLRLTVEIDRGGAGGNGWRASDVSDHS